MGALPRPDVAAGPLRVLFDRLHDLHHKAGWPSLRTMAREVGCSHVTVAAVFSGPRAPRWGLLELVVEALDGDVELFRGLWLEATSQEPAPVAGDLPSPQARPVPRELPADVADFTGRRDALAQLDRILDRGGNGVRIASLSGTPGVGKTALAAHWAHRVGRRFPDGQLFVDLRGYDPGAPVAPAEALGGFLRSLGEAGTALPLSVAELAARYRTLMADRRMLVVLDNAGSVEQVRDLLPGAATCVVVVTSRDALPGLVARHGAVRVELDLLPADEAAGLLSTLIGARAEACLDDVLALADRCAYLPLALRVAAERAVSRPAATLAELAAELAEQPGRLDALAAGDDDATAVRTVFSWSIRQLSPSGRRMFDLLGLHPGQAIDVAGAAALADTAAATACNELSTLHRAHLVSAAEHGRFGMHDLLRAYAAERAAQLPTADRAAALDRLRGHHRRAAAIAVRLKFAGAKPQEAGGVESASGAIGDPADEHGLLVATGVRDAASATVWLDAERFNLMALAAESAADDDTAGHVIALSATLAPYLEACGHYTEAVTLHSAAVTVATETKDTAAAGTALNRLGAVNARSGDLEAALDRYGEALVYCETAGDTAGAATSLHGIAVARFRAGRYQQAMDAAKDALTRSRSLDDLRGAGEALKTIALVRLQLGDYPAAIASLHQALAAHRAAGDRTNEGRSLNNLGFLHYRIGQDAEALRYYEPARAIARELGNRAGEAVALINLAHIDARHGRVEEALDGYRKATVACAAIGYRFGQAEALRGLAVTYRRLGRLHDALEHVNQALALSRRLGDVDMEAGALDDLGGTLRAAGRLQDALRRHTEAYALASRAGDPFAQARALSGLAAVLQAAGQVAAALEHRGRAEALYEKLGVPEHAREGP
ncbi:tetratricopeptide repeat protein [Streptomyces sp. NPDC051940]|uniref:ATP-binding protein n=1 Tax=Streptomyces sp. NPDC051940 TaxID=3155675 RepID=UPI00344481A4